MNFLKIRDNFCKQLSVVLLKLNADELIIKILQIFREKGLNFLICLKKERSERKFNGNFLLHSIKTLPHSAERHELVVLR